jgi:predicted permease
MLSDLLYRLRVLCRRKTLDGELEEELQYHLDRQAEKYGQVEASPDMAMRRAKLALGGKEQVAQQCPETRGTRLLDDLMQDLRYGLRSLANSPAFTVVTVLTLALGIGACTAIFSIVNAVLLRSLPYKDPGKLVYLYSPNSHFKLPIEDIGLSSYADFFDLRRQSHSFSNMTLFQQDTSSLASQNAAIRIGTARVDGGFFPTLGSQPEIGRGIEPRDVEPGHQGVVVIGHALWEQMFSADPEVLSRSLRLDGKAYQIIGVMPGEFQYPRETDPSTKLLKAPTQVWVPLTLSPHQMADRDDGDGYELARLKPGVSVAQAQAEMASIMARLDLLHNPAMRGWGAYVKPFRETAVGPVRPLMWLLLGAVSLVLLIACGNAANLLLARAASRTHELGVRATLGAGRSRMIRQMLTESMMLGLAGGAAGVLLAHLCLRALLRIDPGNIPRLNEATVDLRVLLFAVIVSLLTSVLFGTLPALSASRINLVEFLKSAGSRGSVISRNHLRSGVIVAELALVVILLAGASVLLRSYENVEQVHTGFSLSTVSMNVKLDARYSEPQQGRAFFRNLLTQLAAIPGVKAVGAIDNPPLTGESLTFFSVAGYANQKDQLVEIRNTTPHYFSAMGIPLVAGRVFTDQDLSGGPPVILINQAFAKNYFPGRDPIGQRIFMKQRNFPWRTVVGVVGDVRNVSLEEAAAPQVFEPFWQTDAAYVAIRSVLPAKDVASSVRSTLRRIDPNLALADMHTMREVISEANAQRLFQTTLLTIFAAIAMLLALVGFYGLLAYSVKQRTAEIGVRIALGAPRARVMGMVLRQGFQLAAAGLLIGLTGAMAFTRILSSLLYQVSALDSVTFMVVPALLLLVMLPAALIPAWRATGVEPVTALRYE